MGILAFPGTSRNSRTHGMPPSRWSSGWSPWKRSVVQRYATTNINKQQLPAESVAVAMTSPRRARKWNQMIVSDTTDAAVVAVVAVVAAAVLRRSWIDSPDPSIL